MRETTSKANLLEASTEGLANSSTSLLADDDLAEKPLSDVEKQFLLLAERGDCAGIKR